MGFRFLSLLAVIALLASCTPVGQEKYHNYHHGGTSEDSTMAEQDQSKIIPLLDPQGINMNMMDARLDKMVNEANDIEFQIAILIERLKKMRDEISGFALIQKNEVRADPNAPNDMDINDIVAITLETDTVTSIETPVDSGVVADASIMDLQPSKPAMVKQHKEAEPKPQVKTQSPPQKTSNEPGVFDVRTGVHSDKTRIVFDVNGSTKHSINFDREVGLVTLILPDTQWSTTSSKNFKMTQLSGYDAKSEGNGTAVAMAVSNTSSVDVVTLAPSGSRPARLVIDLMK